jgi:hypothetical protein
MHQVTTEHLIGLMAAHEPPCISLYQPTHRQHPDNEQDPIRYRNLLVEMETSLRETYPIQQFRAILENFHSLSRDDSFWDHRTDGLAIFGSPERFEVLELQRPIQELLIVADSFHTKPLIRALQSANRYQILCLTRQDAKLYEGNRDALDPVPLTNFPSNIADVLGDQRSPTTQMVGSYGTRSGGGGTAVYHRHGPQTDTVEGDILRFFRAVDRGILEYHSRPSNLPLMLVALKEYHGPFREVSHNPYLMRDGIMLNPYALNTDELRERAWEKVEPQYLARLEGLKESFYNAQSQQVGSSDISDVAKAAIAGRVATLLVEADRVIPGTLDRMLGSIRPADLASENVDDMLDDLAELVLTKGGEVIVVPTEQMPTDSGLAAIYRF